MTITLSLLFPKFGKNSLSRAFPLDAEASVLISFALETYPDLPRSIEIYMANDQRQYNVVQPEDQLISLDLKPQHQFVLMPESYDLNFIDGQTRKKYRFKVYNNFTIAEVMKVICVKNQLLEPRFYSVIAGTKELTDEDPITEQAPFVSSVTFQLASHQAIFDLLVEDFKAGLINCTPKNVQYIISALLYVFNGAYKSSMRAQLETNIKELIPNPFQNDATYVKSTVKGVQDTYKKFKADRPIPSTIEYIMHLQHFGAIVSNGERQFGVIGKASTKDKVTYSLKYGILQVYKQASTNLLETYNLSDMQSIGMEGTHTVKFEYDIPDRGGRHAVRLRAENATVLYETIIDRLRVPKRERGYGSGSRSSAEFEIVSAAIPPYLQTFLSVEELPRSELLATATIAALELLALARDVVKQYADNPDRREAPPVIQVMTTFVQLVNKDTTTEMSMTWEQIQGLAGKSGRDAKRDLATRTDRFVGSLLGQETMIQGRPEERSPLPVREVFVGLVRGAALLLLTALWVNERVQCRELVDGIKSSLGELVVRAGAISLYSGGYRDLCAYSERFVHSATELAKSAARADREKAPILRLLGRSEKLLKDSLATIETYFSKHEPFKLIARISPKELSQTAVSDPRAPIKSAIEIINRLSSGPIEDMNGALDQLASLRTLTVLLLSISQANLHQQLIQSFNAFLGDVESSYSTNGSASSKSSAHRCKVALDGVLSSMNPAPDLLRLLDGYLADDPRVVALRPIIAYLDEHGPLFTGSPSHTDIQRFIGQMSTGDTSELAYSIETYVPEELRQLLATCDRTRGLYHEVDQEIPIEQLAIDAGNTAKLVAATAVEVREALRRQELEVVARYRALNLRLWRIMLVFSQFINDESAGSVGHAAFGQCREAFKTLLEESAYDMRRDREFLPFIEEFTGLVDGVIASPYDSKALAGLGKFLVLHQTRPGFFKASRALSEFNHFVIVLDSNRAAHELQERLNLAHKFRITSLMIANLKRRLQTLLGKTELALKTKTASARREGRQIVDLRRDFHSFLTKWIGEIFAIFSQLIVSRCTNQAAIQSLSIGVDAVEKLFPIVVNVEPPTPYLARSVCGITFSSMDLLTEESKKLGGKAAQSAGLAFLAVREFLFNIRRKTAEVEQEDSLWKTGIGIADMCAVIERDNRVIKRQVEFQRSIKKYEWFQHPPIVVPES
jgi:hypothetical protein